MKSFRLLIAVAVLGLAAFVYGAVGMAGLASASTLVDIQKGSMKLFEGDRGICSTTVVDADKLLTAAHCVEGANLNVRFQVFDKDLNVVREEVIYVKAIRTLKTKDIALLAPLDAGFKFTDGGAVVIDVASTEETNATIAFGVPVRAVGFPKAMELTVTDGVFENKVASVDKATWDSLLYKISAPITGGNSGGALYAEFDGAYKLIGVNVAGFRDVSFMNYAVPIESVHAVLAGFVHAQTIEQIIRANSVPSDKTDDK